MTKHNTPNIGGGFHLLPDTEAGEENELSAFLDLVRKQVPEEAYSIK